MRVGVETVTVRRLRERADAPRSSDPPVRGRRATGRRHPGAFVVSFFVRAGVDRRVSTITNADAECVNRGAPTANDVDVKYNYKSSR